MMTISKYFKEEEDLLFRAGQRKGRQAERAKAEQEKKEMAREMARKMIAAKEPLNKIIEYTRLPIEEIQSL